MIAFFIKRGRILLLLLLTFSELCSVVIASEQLSIEQTPVEVNAIGRVFLDKRTNEFYLYLTNNSLEIAYPILINNKKIFNQLKNLNKKWVRVSGQKKWIKETYIELSHHLQKIEIDQIEEFRLSELQVFKINNQSKITEIDYRIIDKDKTKSHDSKGIPISDEAANSMITGAGIIMGIAIGPMSLIPAGIFGLKSLLLDD